MEVVNIYKKEVVKTNRNGRQNQGISTTSINNISGLGSDYDFVNGLTILSGSTGNTGTTINTKVSLSGAYTGNTENLGTWSITGGSISTVNDVTIVTPFISGYTGNTVSIKGNVFVDGTITTTSTNNIINSFNISGATDVNNYFSGNTALHSLSANTALFALSANTVNWNNVNSLPNYFTPASGSTFYIQNQYSSAQPANMWINGNITSGAIKSAGTFVSGFAGSGTLLDLGTNEMTLDKLTVRGEMNIYELIINKIRATNGSLWVSDAVKFTSVDAVINQNQYCYVDADTDITFALNDVVKAQNFNGRNVRVASGVVTNITGTRITILLDNINNPFWVNAETVRIGNTTNTNRQGALYLTSSDNNSPYLDILNGVTSTNFSGKTKVRLGRLDGIVDATFGSLSGYGLYCQNGYFSGAINVTGGNAATTTAVSTAQSTAISTAASDATTKANNAYSGAVSAASSDATTKANNAYSGAVSTASSDATTKANAAQSAAISTASSDATTKANAAQSAAISAAAADATSKANSAQSAAISSSQTFTNSAITDLKTNYLGDLAILDTLEGGKINDATVSLSKLGNTIIQGGYIKTTLLDATAIRSDIINTGYIQGLSLNFTQGNIGGWNINSTYLNKDNGNYSAGLSPLDYPFYAGNTYTNRATAPFRVAVDGEVNITSKCNVKNTSTGCEVLMGGTELPFGFGSGALYAKGTTTNSGLDTNAIQAQASGGSHNYAIQAQATGSGYNTAVLAQANGGTQNTAIAAEGDVVVNFGGIEVKGTSYSCGLTLPLESIYSANSTMSSYSRIFCIYLTSAAADIYLPYISDFKVGEMIHISNFGSKSAYVKSNSTDNATINTKSKSSNYLTMYANCSGACLVKQGNNNWNIISYSNAAF